jgi:hypothetical protein
MRHAERAQRRAHVVELAVVEQRDPGALGFHRTSE